MSETFFGEILITNAENGSVRVRIDGPGGNLWLGGNGGDGDLVLFKSDGDNKTLSKATIHLDGQGGNIWAGGNGTDGDVVLFPSSATDLTDLSQASIHLDGQAGDIKLAGADCAEHFVVADPTRAIAGTVLVVEDESTLAPCADAYDSRVAGVVSGAGDYRPGVVLGTGATSGSSVPIALAGRVYCQVDADFAPICVGDLLTTSTRQGHAMKATDREAGCAPHRSAATRAPCVAACHRDRR